MKTNSLMNCIKQLEISTSNSIEFVMSMLIAGKSIQVNSFVIVDIAYFFLFKQ